MNYSGIVAGISSFPFNDTKLWSFQLKNVRTYFRTGQKAPDFEMGQFVEFEGEADEKGNVKVDPKTIKVSDPHQTPEVKGVKGFRTAIPKASNAEMTSNGYWEARTIRDIETQKRIEIQSCRNSALQFIEILASMEALRLGA